MTTYADIQNAIREGIVTLSGLHDKAVSWSDNARGAGKTLIVLDELYAQEQDFRECYTPTQADPTKFAWTAMSLYYIRIQIRVESIYAQPGSDAMVALHRVMAGLRRPSFDWGLGKDLRHQMDNTTYIHHISFPHDTTTINARAFETGFRAVVDFPTTETEPDAPGMQTVLVDTGETEIGEPSPVETSLTIARP